MCCFLVPMAQAIATTVYRKTAAKAISSPEASVLKHSIPDLEKMLWGGTVMLIVDHIISGELTYQFPFFTALGQKGGADIMLHEMLTVGVPMSVVITAVWAIYALTKKRVKAAA